MENAMFPICKGCVPAKCWTAEICASIHKDYREKALASWRADIQKARRSDKKLVTPFADHMD